MSEREIHPPSPDLDRFHHMLDGVKAFKDLLKQRRSLSFAEIDQIAQRYKTDTATLLRDAELSHDCLVDYTKSVVTCS